MARRFKELLNKMSPEARAEVERRVKASIEEMPLMELRAARELTQESIASVLGIKQAAVSRLERRADMYVSTLSKFVEAMGGKLEIRAVFPDGSVILNQFAEEIETAQSTNRKSTASHRRPSAARK